MFEFCRAPGADPSRPLRSNLISKSPLQLPDHPAVHIEVFCSLREVETIWRKAQADCACYGFQTFEWLSTFQETIGSAEGIEPRIVHITDANGDTLMLLPLGMRRRLGLSFLNLLGGDVTDYHAPIIRAEFAASLNAGTIGRLLACVLERLPTVDVIAFENMPSEIEGVLNPLASLFSAKHRSNAYVATLGATFDDFKRRRSAKFFSTGARKWRRLCEMSPARFYIAESAAAAAEILCALIRQKRRQYGETGARDQFDKPQYLAFYSALAERHLETGLVHASALLAGETVVAAHLGIVFRNRFYWLMPSYENGKWARFSVGRLLMQFLIEWSISRGLTRFDLTIGDDDYKQLWSDHNVPLYNFICGLTGKGKAYRMALLASRGAKDWAKRKLQLGALVRAWRRRMPPS